MSEQISRRNWLKLSALASSAVAITPNLVSNNVAAQKLSLKKPVRLFANENAYGFSPKAKQVILDSVGMGNQYADSAKVVELEKLIAEREGLKPENVILGSGSGEVLCMAGTAYGWENGEIVTPFPTFSTIYRYAEKFGAKVKKVPLNEKHALDLNAMYKKVSGKTSLVYVCNPNNPTGTILPTKQVKDFCETVSRRTTVYVDEAYLEYTDDYPRNSMVGMIRENKNVIVSRTFSKIYGMAGMRVGYGLAKKEIADKLKNFRMSWFNSLGINSAVAAYKDTEFIKQSSRKNKQVREFLYREFTKMKMPYAESHGNYIWLNVGAKNSNLSEKMRPTNLLVSSPRKPFENWIRLTIGTKEQMEIFTKVLSQTA